MLGKWFRRWNSSQTKTAGNWPLDLPLGTFGPGNVWRLGDAVTGTMVLGSTGSGKSSAVARCLLLWMLKAGLGGLVLCVKPEDREDIERYARQCGRERDLVIFGPRQPHKMNLLELELNQAGDKVHRLENVVQLFRIILEIAEKDRHANSSSGDNKYFERAALQMIRSALLVLILANEAITLENIYRFIVSASRSLDESRDDAWREQSYCYKTLCKADDQAHSDSLEKDFTLSLLYWMQEFPAMDAKPRGSIVSTYTTMADLFQRGVIRETFFGETTVTPDACREGKIFILDFATLRWNEIGRIVQAMVKYVWQRSQERCDVAAMPRPVFLFSDEAQTFLTSFDGPFQATARSSRVCTLYVSQNLPGMYESVGGESGRHVIDSLLGNLRLKIFCAQDDPITCQWQSELIGKTKRLLFNSNTQSAADQPFNFFRPHRHQSAGFSESWEYVIQPWEWSGGLRTGGPQHAFAVDAIAYQGGRIWNGSGKSYLRVTFPQS